MTRMKFYGTALLGVGMTAFALWMVTTLALGAFATGALVVLGAAALVVTAYMMSYQIEQATAEAQESR